MTFPRLASNCPSGEVFQLFVAKFGVSHNPGLSVKNSTITDEVACTGLFVRQAKLPEGCREDGLVELLRIPRESTFSIHTILEILNDKSNYKTEAAFLKTSSTVKDLFGTFCQSSAIISRVSETLLLVVYFVIFDCLSRSAYELPSVIKLYLQQVLLKTEVGSLYSDLPLKDACVVRQFFGHYGVGGILDVFEMVVCLVQRSFSLDDIVERTSRIFAAISSRCLEIPEELSLDSEDFTVNSTLVPILDYANHDNDKVNAHFDVDRGNCDVVLLLDRNALDEKNDETEVFISYSPVEELFQFETAYGFFPKLSQNSAGVQFWNLCIDQNYFKVEKPWGINLDMFYKWFSIKPCIQCVLYEDQVLINDAIEEFGEFLLPFAPNPVHGEESCFQYNIQAYKSFARFASKANDRSEEDYLQHFREYIDSREKSKDQAIAMPQLAWTCYFVGDRYTYARLDKGQCIDVVFESDDAYGCTRDLFTDYLRNYCFWRIRALTLLKFEDFSLSVQKIAQLELLVLNKIVDQLNAGEPTFWTDLNGSTTLKLPKCPLPPLLQMSGECLAEISRPDTNFEESEYTDFFDEELDRYLDFFTQLS